MHGTGPFFDFGSFAMRRPFVQRVPTFGVRCRAKLKPRSKLVHESKDHKSLGELKCASDFCLAFCFSNPCPAVKVHQFDRSHVLHLSWFHWNGFGMKRDVLHISSHVLHMSSLFQSNSIYLHNLLHLALTFSALTSPCSGHQWTLRRNALSSWEGRFTLRCSKRSRSILFLLYQKHHLTYL